MDKNDDKSAMLEEKQRELEKLQQEQDTLEKLRQDSEKQLREFIDKNPKEFIKLMCEAALGTETDYENPFRMKEGSQGRFPSYIRGLAQMILGKVMDVEPAMSKTGYTSFLSVIFDYFHFSNFLRSDDAVRRFDLNAIQHDFFSQYADPLASAIDSTCRFVFEGLPLYRKLDEGQEFERVAFDDPIYIYALKKGEYFESGPTMHVPDWVEGLYFKNTDWELHEAFFSGSGELLDSERDLRRNALWTALKINPNSKESDLENDLEQMNLHLDSANGKISLLEEQLRRTMESCSEDAASSAEAERLRLEVDELKAQLQEAADKLARNDKENLKPNQRPTVLRLIGGLAMVAHGIDIHAKRINGISEVVRDLETRGVNVSEETLRTYLKEASLIISKSDGRTAD